MSIEINGMSIHDYIEKQKKEGQFVNLIKAETITQGKRSTVIRGGRVNITRKGKTYTFQGKLIERRGDDWYVDGERFDFDGEQAETGSEQIKIEIHGTVEKLETENGDVTVNGDVSTITTTSGNVHCNEAAYISTMSGDVTCKGRPASVNTMSGDINYQKL